MESNESCELLKLNTLLQSCDCDVCVLFVMMCVCDVVCKFVWDVMQAYEINLRQLSAGALIISK